MVWIVLWYIAHVWPYDWRQWHYTEEELWPYLAIVDHFEDFLVLFTPIYSQKITNITPLEIIWNLTSKWLKKAKIWQKRGKNKRTFGKNTFCASVTNYCPESANNGIMGPTCWIFFSVQCEKVPRIRMLMCLVYYKVLGPF